MADIVPPSRQALSEALVLSEEILRNLELSELPLAAVALKASRLARLLNDFDYQRIFEYEASGYPSTPTGVPPDVFALARKAARVYAEKDSTTHLEIERAYITSIGQLETEIQTSQAALEAAKDANVSISSANPSQYVMKPAGNVIERNAIRAAISTAAGRLAARRGLLHTYASQRHYELKFSGIASDIFSRIRERVDGSIGGTVPTAVQKLTAIYDNLASDNPEDWSNAVHSCRRILQDLADAIYPARADKVVEANGKGRTIKLGPDNYINRLIAYIEDRSDSERFQAIVGSNLRFIGERLDAVFQAAQKGSHSLITDRGEADRYVIYTYMIVGDVLALSAA